MKRRGKQWARINVVIDGVVIDGGYHNRNENETAAFAGVMNTLYIGRVYAVYGSGSAC